MSARLSAQSRQFLTILWSLEIYLKPQTSLEGFLGAVETRLEVPATPFILPLF